jgi:hypothetical protein
VSAVEVVPYDAGRRGDYVRLYASVWGARAPSGEVLDWWFDGNPEGGMRSVAVRDGELVGAAGHSFFRARVGDGEQRVAFSLHAVTDSSARGRGVFSALELRHDEESTGRGAVSALVFPNAASRPIYAGRLGFRTIDRRRVWARPLRGALRRLRGRHQEPGATAAGGIRRLDRFDDVTDAVYERQAARLANHLVRDARHLNWRYLDAPRPYRALATDGGFAVVGRSERRRASLGVLLDVVADPAAVPALVRACAREVGGACDALLALPTPLLPRSVLSRLGFVPTTLRVDLLGKPLAGRLDAEPWTLSLGDTDFF